MAEPAPKPIYRRDYRPPDYTMDSISLDFDLRDSVTTVKSTLVVKPNFSSEVCPPLVLDGRSDVKLLYLRVGGSDWPQDKYTLTSKALTLLGLPAGKLQIEICTEINPEKNTFLEGLYKSKGIYSTHCEAVGFRAITYYLDRPDVLAKYTVRIEAHKAAYPVLLSNGNLVEEGPAQEPGRHFAVYVDPFPKPSYLFALVAGDLAKLADSFTTMSGKTVTLQIFAQHHNIDKLAWAMESLKKAMKWDEDRFGREYDLERYTIFVVDDFNMGAMENKSLNIFNAKRILATPSTATDTEYTDILRVIGHEYFHNWTGNRVTVRDWFQLTLKEGLTSFREMEFGSDMTSRPVSRIQAVRLLRTAQFPEDSGPLAHPIRPDSYIKMDNFYTSTVYKKGCEVHRLYLTLLGKEGFRKGMDLYFERNDGQAVACEDYIKAMGDANGRDLSMMSRWYCQSGTPQVSVKTEYKAADKTFTVNIKQHTPPTPAQPVKEPVLIPIVVGLLDSKGQDLPLKLKGSTETGCMTMVLELDKEEDCFVFESVPERPVPSLLRGFSAPVKLTIDGETDEDLMLMLAHDSDTFNRWEAGQKLAKKLLLKFCSDGQDNGSGATLNERLDAAGGVPKSYLEALRIILCDQDLDMGFKALALTLPSEQEILTELSCDIDPLLVHGVRQYAGKAVATALRQEFLEVYNCSSVGLDTVVEYDPEAAGRRAVRNTSLHYLCLAGDEKAYHMAAEQYDMAVNMTEVIGAMVAMNDIDHSARDLMLSRFHDAWKDNNNTITKYLNFVAMSNIPGNISKVKEVMKEPIFVKTNPNCVRAVVAGFMTSAVNFHAADGNGYEFAADVLLDLDKVNPTTTARMAHGFATWRRLDEGRRTLMQSQLKRILATEGVSENLMEVVSNLIA
eukprot:evm.model.scf_468.3 EVM.evm.TU.scf_468.3   scf_468:11464-18475(-)